MKGRGCNHLAFPTAKDVRQQANNWVDYGKALSAMCFRMQQNAMPLEIDSQSFLANLNSRARV